MPSGALLKWAQVLALLWNSSHVNKPTNRTSLHSKKPSLNFDKSNVVWCHPVRRKRPPLVMLSLGMSHVKFFNFSTFFSGKMFLSHNFLKSFSSKESILLDLKNLATIFWLVSTFLIISNTFLTNHIVGVTWPTFRDFVIVIWAHKGSLQKHGLAVPLKREGY